MLILSIRTDAPEAEIGLHDGDQQLAQRRWSAHRELAVTLHRRIQDALDDIGKQLGDLTGIACFQGPGSFTGLRLGMTVGDALAYGLGIPIVATTGDDWLQHAVERLQAGEDEHIALPLYGSPPHITQQKK